ncbi:MAG TPA: polyphosphate kinase 1 [Bacteroidota bacterium]|nr:polyphosphate kinase 1 [Bacteroidota bacterium]
MKEKNLVLKHRDLSWLSFNHRVLQEAADRRNPLYERIKFLAIYSSNLDEFFRVRVPSQRALLELKKKTAKKLDFDPQEVLTRIRKVVTLQQEEFGDIFRNSIRRELRRNRIAIVNDTELNPDRRAEVLKYFHETVAPHLHPVFLIPGRESPFLENRALYLVIRLLKKPAVDTPEKTPEDDSTQFVLMEIPVGPLGRFYELPYDGKLHCVMFLDDVVRAGLPEFFPQHEVKGARAVKLSRDAELYIDDEFSGDLVEKIRKAIGKRKEGLPSRLLYDQDLSKKTLSVLVNFFHFQDDLVPGGRYHNFHHFFDFPNPIGPKLMFEPWETVDPGIEGYTPPDDIPPADRVPEAAGPAPPGAETSGEPKPVKPPAGSLMAAIRRRDILLYYPYHSYMTVVDFLREAADDTAVTAIEITLYRVARDSKVVLQLIRAARAGKSVTAFVEVKARFDEESNFYWAEELQKAGARIFYSFPGLKVHAKLCLVSRREHDTPVGYGYLATGNFNENAARQYTDFGLFTADPRITDEMQKVFNILERRKQQGEFGHLLVSPYAMRDRLDELIDREIRNAAEGKEASIVAKMNSLEDRKIIARLYEAGEAGVKISLIVRGICCLVPSAKGPGKNIEVVSIVDRFLEHARVYMFHNGGDEQVYLSSADWMNRNLSHRIEAAFPVYDPEIKKKIRAIIDIQLKDTVKARTINKAQDNKYRKGAPEVRAQYAIREYLGARLRD